MYVLIKHKHLRLISLSAEDLSKPVDIRIKKKLKKKKS